MYCKTATWGLHKTNKIGQNSIPLPHAYESSKLSSSSSSSSVALQPGSGLGLSLRVFVMVRYARCEVIGPTINLVLVILIRPPRHLLAKPADLVRYHRGKSHCILLVMFYGTKIRHWGHMIFTVRNFSCRSKIIYVIFQWCFSLTSTH
jgi:hypothetical protein